MVAVDRPIRAPAAGLRARRAGGYARMLWALSASVSVHLLMIGGIAPGAMRVYALFPAQMLEARLERVAAPAESLEDAREPVGAERAKRPPDGARARDDAERASLPAAPRTGTQSNAVDNQAPPHDMQRPAPAPADPVYYSARELDVYPTPLTPLHFGNPARLAGAWIGGDVQVTLMLDEAGTVDRITVIAGETPGSFEEHVRAKLASARFSPGRRDGRAVKSQVTVRVSLDPAAREGASR